MRTGMLPLRLPAEPCQPTSLQVRSISRGLNPHRTLHQSPIAAYRAQGHGLPQRRVAPAGQCALPTKKESKRSSAELSSLMPSQGRGGSTPPATPRKRAAGGMQPTTGPGRVSRRPERAQRRGDPVRRPAPDRNPTPPGCMPPGAEPPRGPSFPLPISNHADAERDTDHDDIPHRHNHLWKHEEVARRSRLRDHRYRNLPPPRRRLH